MGTQPVVSSVLYFEWQVSSTCVSQSTGSPGGTPRAVPRLANIKYLHKHFQYVCGSESLGSRRGAPFSLS